MIDRTATSATRPRTINWLVLALGLLASAGTTYGWENLLKDPGFEAYRLDPRGFYVPRDDSGWQEIAFGRGSVQFDASQWKAPEDMKRERPLGFSPGTTGFEGQGPEQNTGRLTLQQDIVKPDLFGKPGQKYEAWVWLGGGGKDADTNIDRADEAGGWEIYFYASDDPSTWKESEALEYHQIKKDFFGEPGSFVKLAGLGSVPTGTRGIRMRVWATTWAQSAMGAYGTEVALDNAHFAIVDTENMLINGNFEFDSRPGEFKGWQRPAAWPFPQNGMEPLDINNAYGDNFDHGGFRPFYGNRWAYGYTTYLRGWHNDAFTFSQFVDYDLPADTPLMLTFYWIQAAAQPGKAFNMRYIGTRVEVVVEYLKGREKLGAEGFLCTWPVPPKSANTCRYDHNNESAHAPWFHLEPPRGTERVGLHVNFIVDMPYHPDWSLMTGAVDDFFLAPAIPVEKAN